MYLSRTRHGRRFSAGSADDAVLSADGVLFCQQHDWFVGTKLYKKHLESFVQKKGMTRRTKISILASVTLLMGFGFFMMARKGIWIPCFILAAVWLAHLLYFIFGVKTIKEETESEHV